MQSGKAFADIGTGGRKFNDNRKSFGKCDVRGVRNAFAISRRESATFAVFVCCATDTDTNDATRSAHRFEFIDVGVNNAGNFRSELHCSTGVGREPSAVGVGGGGRSHQSGVER